MRSASRLRSVDVVPAKITSAPYPRAPSTLTWGPCVGMTTTAGAPRSSAASAGERLAVIARRVGDDAATEDVSVDLPHHVGGAANLERAGDLQVLALQPEAAAVAVDGCRQKGCAADDGRDTIRRTSNRVERHEFRKVSSHDVSRSDAVMSDLNDRLVSDLIDSVKQVLRKEAAERLREVYLVGDIDKDSARSVIERLRELANESPRPDHACISTRAGGNVTDGLAIHDVDPRARRARRRSSPRRAGDGVLDGVGRAAGGEPWRPARLSRIRGS